MPFLKCPTAPTIPSLRRLNLTSSPSSSVYPTPSTSRLVSTLPQRPALFSCTAQATDARARRASRRCFSDQMSFRLRNGSMKVNLASKHTVGISQSRGDRPYQEDAYNVQAILCPIAALKKNAPGWSPESLEGYAGEDPALAEGNGKRQVAFFGVYDG